MFARSLLIIVATLALAAGTASAQQAPANDHAKPKARAHHNKADKNTPKDHLSRIYKMMADELNFTPEQRQKLSQIAADRQKAIVQWQKDNAEAGKKAKADMKKARADKDKDAMKAAREEWNKLRQSREAALKPFGDQIHDLMTPDQQAKWVGFSEYRGLMRHFHKAKLTDEQQAKVKTMAENAGKDLLAAEKAGTKQLRQARAQLTEQIYKEVLTPEQQKLVSHKAPHKNGKAMHKKKKANQG